MKKSVTNSLKRGVYNLAKANGVLPTKKMYRRVKKLYLKSSGETRSKMRE